jgi:uncharacterized repeat protein (TIGR01451 family)
MSLQVHAGAAPAATALVSVNSAGTDGGNGPSGEQAISADGRLIAFASLGDDLGPSDPGSDGDIYVRDLVAGTTTLVSVNSAGTDGGNGFSVNPEISADGRFVAFESQANDLGPTDADVDSDIYVRDLVTATTILASVNSAGTDGGNSLSINPLISADGRFVAFQSFASDLGPVADADVDSDIYVRDLVAATTILASVNSSGTDGGNAASDLAVISADGRFVAFRSEANNLGPTDAGADSDIYVRDLVANTTILASVNSAGTDGGNGTSSQPAIGGDGRFVAFESFASNLGPANAGTVSDIYVRDLVAGTTTMASVNSAGTDGGSFGSVEPKISAGGRFVAFRSEANNLGPPDAGTDIDVYVRDLVTGTTTLVSVNSAGTDGGNGDSFGPVIGADGRLVAFTSQAGDLGPPDAGFDLDVYVRDLVAGTTILASVNSGGTDGGNANSAFPVMSADGRFVVFSSVASNLGPPDSGTDLDVYVRRLASGNLTIDKTTVGGTGNFTFSINCHDDRFDDPAVSIANSNNHVVPDVPVGTECTVTEQPNPLFISSPAGPQTVTVDEDGVTVAITNTRATVDLRITKSCPAASPGTFNCKLTVTNTGTAAAQNVVVTDDLPPGLNAGPVTFSNPSFSCSDPPGAVDIRCTAPTLAAGASATFSYSVFAGETVSPGQSFTNVARVSASAQDPTPGNNQASASLKIPVCQKTGSVLNGTLGNDVLCGTAGIDSINGLAGNDLIFLFGGNDNAQGADGNDIIIGGPGNDNLQGGNGNDRLFGNDGDDKLQGAAGTDLGVGGPGADLCTSTESGVC